MEYFIKIPNKLVTFSFIILSVLIYWPFVFKKLSVPFLIINSEINLNSFLAREYLKLPGNNLVILRHSKEEKKFLYETVWTLVNYSTRKVVVFFKSVFHFQFFSSSISFSLSRHHVHLAPKGWISLTKLLNLKFFRFHISLAKRTQREQARESLVKINH